MARTYTEQALHIVDRMLEVAKRDHTVSRSRGIEFHESGYILLDDQRIGHDSAVQALASLLEQEERQIEENANPPAPTKKEKSQKGQVTWDSLNEATKGLLLRTDQRDFFVEYVQPKIGLKNAPRLSNLKRAGLDRQSRRREESRNGHSRSHLRAKRFYTVPREQDVGWSTRPHEVMAEAKEIAEASRDGRGLTALQRAFWESNRKAPQT